MAKENKPYLPWYGREFYSDQNVQVMTLPQEAAYLRLIWSCWQEGSIPSEADKLAALCKNTPPRAFAKEIWPALSILFVTGDDGRLYHPKVERVREQTKSFRDKCSRAGKIGNQRRWGNDRVPDVIATTNPTENASGEQFGVDHETIRSDFRFPNSDINTKPCSSAIANEPAVGASLSIDDPPFETTEPSALFPVTHKPKTARGSLSPQQENWFMEWWNLYWRKVARKTAREAFGKQVTTEERFAVVMDATRRQSAAMLAREPSKRPHGATWLNGERWADELPDAAGVANDSVIAMIRRNDG